MNREEEVERALFETRFAALLERYRVQKDLTHAEEKTYRLTILGYSPQEAADELGVALDTLHKHSSHAARKLGHPTLLKAALHFALELAGAPAAVHQHPRTRSGTLRRP